ncbi:class I SAM-dependent methyltransferase [Anabaena cylindrica FACHB-243]|uniref:Methyltransferase type 11 n=1 Tax=Anabaena cylindrica (strain ATCC 27899 / PCC 7122) TaxID=272123 RepID=K9ZPG2_ANACC|nr:MULTISPECIES: class I SAM-dependent methyltransferase [Anabaena]AFZ60437.1 Methyltransferase type 11 [Anabaena cylindrica PCC 7122]MBD2416424.1 class I SAM-dependent methyltransferase [Anabaena cylindrica FACHB-243]MBY5280566.1 class I SAM-dependent methyltransferase [Anabaena sp. CCAP 1446/1C]MBY5309051.1 class I SAM-dependent methyltransferase [Anabaena sp. CCAP 1446/1C]MCM2408477.1 class I SAM-dependent methyltransferase [Anabaena sp. CCAP 1446/1C]
MNTKIKPDWAGQGLLSQFVNLLINTKPIYSLMKQQARQVMIKTAEKNGVAWRKNYEKLEASGIKEKLTEVVNPNVVYPEYYKVPFHAYSEGNLCWKAAFEAPSATYAMGLRVWPKEKITWQTANHRLRSSFHEVLGTYVTQDVQDILDIGCSVGISTLEIHRYYQQKQNHPVNTIGLDLSPYMLSVAKQLDVDNEISQWLHTQAENTGLANESFDLVTLQFVTHELPSFASQAIFQEALRLLRPGGCFAIVDNNPKSPVIQNLPPVLFTLMKSTEPWSDEYYMFDIEGTLQTIGFEVLTTVSTDPRHRAIVAKKTIL